MDYRAMFDREYIGAWDLGGQDRTVTIAAVEAREVTNGKKKNRRPVIRFRGADKAFLCNKTNAKIIAAMYGNDTRGWVGKRVTLFPTMTDFGDQRVDAIRVRPVIPPGRSAPLPSRPVDAEMRVRQDAAARAAEGAAASSDAGDAGDGSGDTQDADGALQ